MNVTRSSMTMLTIKLTAPLKDAWKEVCRVSRVAYEALLGLGASFVNWIFPRNPVTHHREIRLIPTWLERYLGSLEYASLCPPSQTQTHGNWHDTLQEVGNRLVAACPCKDTLDFEFRLLVSNVVNAFCLPGGKICITTGLMEKLEGEEVQDLDLEGVSFEDKVAAVLSHEIVHGCASHGVKRLELALLFGLGGRLMGKLLGGIIQRREEGRVNRSRWSRSERRKVRERAELIGKGIEYVVELVGKLGSVLLLRKYSRSNEFQADLVGMEYAKKAAYDPRGAVWLQKMFLEMHRDQQEGSVQKVMALFQTHPPSSERLARCREKLAEFGDPPRLALTWVPSHP